jgi:glutathione S-transferase
MAAKLFYTPTSCGAASYIAALRGGLLGSKVQPYEADIRAHKIVTGPDAGKSLYDVNPKGNVPSLVLPDGTLLNENAAVLQWIADQAPDSKLVPPWGTSERYLLQSKLSYLGTEVHAAFRPLFNPATKGETRDALTAELKAKLKYLAEHELAGGRKYLVGDDFTVADSYLYVMLRWPQYVGVDLAEFPVLVAYRDGIGALDFVKRAHDEMAAASK